MGKRKVIFLSTVDYENTDMYKIIVGNNTEVNYFENYHFKYEDDPKHKWCKIISSQGIDVEFWYFSSKNEDYTFYHKYGHKVRRIKQDISFWHLNYSFRLFNKLKEYSPSHIICVPYFFNHWMLIDMFDILTIFCKNNGIKFYGLYGGGTIDAYKFTLKKYLKLLFLSLTDGIFCQSNIEIDIMKSKYNLNESKVINLKNPVDLQNFNPIGKKFCADKLNLDKNCKYILFAGRLSYRKGAHEILLLFPSIKKRFKDTKILFVGIGSFEKNLRKLARKMGISSDVHFRGWVTSDELNYYYNLSEVLVLPTLSHEGTPNTIIEAISCNLPTVAYNSGSVSNILNSNFGFLVNVGDRKFFLTSIFKILRGQFTLNPTERLKLLEEVDSTITGTRLNRILS